MVGERAKEVQLSSHNVENHFLADVDRSILSLPETGLRREDLEDRDFLLVSESDIW